MSLGLKKRRPSARERESDKANTLSKRQSKELQQRAYLDPPLYASSLNRRDVNRYRPLLHLARPRENKRRICQNSLHRKYKERNDTPLPKHEIFVRFASILSRAINGGRTG